jgi:hypothetical protein
MKNTTQEMIEAVKEMAMANYNKGYGYQQIVECYTDEEIAETLAEAKVRTVGGAVRFFKKLAKDVGGYHDEIASTAW